MVDAIVRAADIMGRLLDADEDGDLAGVDVDREELTALLPLLGLERFDRRACNRALCALDLSVDTATAAEGSRG